MVQVVPDYFPRFANQYVPAMEYVAGVVHGEPYTVSLGTPAVVDTDGLISNGDADAAATTRVTVNAEADSPYGRTIILTPDADPGAGWSVAIGGRDYLGQPVWETLTSSGGGTGALYGHKAFKYVDFTHIVVPAPNAVTFDLGWGYRLGLPYKFAGVQWVQEAGVFVPAYPPLITLTADLDAAKATAGGSHFLRTPVPGYIQTLRGISHGGGSTNNPVVTVELGGAAVVGLTVTIDTSAAGNIVTDVPTTPGYNANNRLRAGDAIELVSTAAASAGAVSIEVDVVATQFAVADGTDPATATTGDPRGTFEAAQAFDGSKQFEIAYFIDRDVNAAGNGGMHGLRHYYP